MDTGSWVKNSTKGESNMRTKLRGKISLLFVTLAVMLAIPAIALADIIVADGDTVTVGNQAGSSENPIDIGKVKAGGTVTKQLTLRTGLR